MKHSTHGRFIVTAILISACSDSASPSTVPPDFGRDLRPGEYQVSVTGDVRRSFEATGATLTELGAPTSQMHLYLMGDPDALDGAQFDLCSAPAPGTFVYDAMTAFTGCPADPGRALGGFIVQLGAPQQDELDCYPNGYGNKAFDGVLTITAVTAGDIAGEAQGTGTCSRHPHSETVPMRSAVVSIRVRFRAVRQTG